MTLAQMTDLAGRGGLAAGFVALLLLLFGAIACRRQAFTAALLILGGACFAGGGAIGALATAVFLSGGGAP
jgi:hypothetical protein